MITAALIIVPTLIISLWCQWRRFYLVAGLVGGTLMFFLTLVALAVAQYFAAQTGAPLADHVLLPLDANIANWAGMYEAVWERPWLWHILIWFYDRTFWCLWFLTLTLAWFDRGRLWRLLLANLICGLAVMVIFAALPTIGPEASLGLPEHWPSVGLSKSVHILTRLRAEGGSLPRDGLVFFPSYHAVGVALTAYGAAGLPKVLRWLLYAWCVVSIISVVPIGGHYFLDALVGLLMPAAWLARKKLVWSMVRQTAS